MKYDYRGLLGGAAKSLTKSDAGYAFALYELADNLGTLLRGECSLDEFKGCYVGWDGGKFIRDGLMPGEKGYPKYAAPAPVKRDDGP